MGFIENLKKIRKEKKITQKHLAELLGKNQVTIARYETGEITPPLKVIEEIAHILNVSKVDLLKEKKTIDWKKIDDAVESSLKEWEEKEILKQGIQIKLNGFLESLNYDVSFTEEANGEIGYILITDGNTFYKLPYDELDDFLKNITKYISFLLSSYEVDKDEWDLY